MSRKTGIGRAGRFLSLAAAGLAAWAATAAGAAGGAGAGLEAGFRDVPMADRPWVYWWWLKGNVSESSITRDLEAMKQMGVGGLLMFDARGYHEDHVVPPESRMEFMSPEWRRMLRFSLGEAARLGLEVSVNLSSCAGALKGPWEVGADAPKRLVWTAADVEGGRRVERTFAAPALPHFTDVALLAVRREAAAPAAATAPAAADAWQDIVAKPGAGPAAAEVVDLSRRLDRAGRLAWDAPAGRWTLVRFGCATMEGHEYDVDVLDPAAVRGHFDRMGRAILEDAGPLAGRTLTHFYSVSWEGATPTWTPGLEREFVSYRGYPLRNWLPVLAGIPVKSEAGSARFRRDYYKTLGDCFMNNFYGTLQDLCHRNGLRWHSESGGPWDRKLVSFEEADQLAFLARNDMPQGEFWFRGRAMNRPAAMTAHIYGRRLAATESFTHMIQHWSAYPAALKVDGDGAFCDGSNHLIWHTFTASPPELGLPGSEYFAGTHINPNVTWWPMSRAFIDYLARCQYLLRQGRAVADVACYTGDKPYQHWGRGTNWSELATLRLGPGRTYDLLSTEVLLDRMTVRNGRPTLPDGTSYAALVVDPDDDAMPPRALRKIASLARAGATVVLGGRRPARAPDFAGYPACDDEVRRLAAELWGDAAAAPGRRAIGRGFAVTGAAVDDVLREARVAPDCEGPWRWTHRAGDGLDLYFVAGTGEADVTFRVAGREPELWDPVTGTVRDAVCWRDSGDGRTVVPLSLPENGAVFVIFRRPAEAKRLAAGGPAAGREIAGRDGAASAVVRVWNADGKESGLPAPMALEGLWAVRFQAGRGAPESAVFEKLTPWDRHPVEGIRHFSGIGTYRIDAELTAGQAAGLVRLDLGEVKYVARVRVNGKDLGVVWTAPWSADLTGAVRAGRNEIEIEVANLWVNRLIGDAALPPEKRLTKTNVTLQPGKRTVKVYQGFGSEDPLLPSGLLGPARLVFGRQDQLPL